MTTERTRVGWSMAAGIAGSTIFVGVVVAALFYFDLQDSVIRFLQWLNGMGLWAPLLFALVMALVVVFLLPGVLLTTGAGFVFGVVTGTVSVVIGTTLGAAVAFMVARGTFGDRASEYVLQHPKMRALDSQLPPQAWKIVMLSRLIPFFPSKLSNYFFGLTSVSLRAFVLGSLIGFIPFSLHNVYLGAIAAELTTEGLRTAGFGEMEWAVYIGAFVLVIAAAFYLARWAWRSLGRQGAANAHAGPANGGEA